MRPINPFFLQLANDRYEEGKRYYLNVPEEESNKERGFYFLAEKEYWMNLPEHIAHRFPSPKHLRAYCLIETGFYKERHTDCLTEDKAVELMLWMKKKDEYSRYQIDGSVVVEQTPMGMKKGEASPKEARKARSAVLELLSEITGITVVAMKKNAGQSA